MRVLGVMFFAVALMATDTTWAQDVCRGGRGQSIDACAGGGTSTVAASSYPANARCAKVLTAPEGESVGLSVYALGLESHFDWLTIFDGDSDRAPVLFRLSGNAPPTDVVWSSSNSMFLTVESDGSAQGVGFSATSQCGIPELCELTAPNPSHGTLGTCDERLPHGASCRLECAAGYSDLSMELSCGNGELLHALHSCAQDCRSNGPGVDGACTVGADGAATVGSVDRGAQAVFAFKAEAGLQYQVDINIHGLPLGISDTVAYIMDESGTQLATNDDGHPPDRAPGPGCNSNNEESCASYIEWDCPASGIYYAAVEGYGGHYSGTFVISVTARGGVVRSRPALVPNDEPIRIQTSCYAPGWARGRNLLRRGPPLLAAAEMWRCCLLQRSIPAELHPRHPAGCRAGRPARVF